MGLKLQTIIEMDDGGEVWMWSLTEQPDCKLKLILCSSENDHPSSSFFLPSKVTNYNFAAKTGNFNGDSKYAKYLRAAICGIVYTQKMSGVLAFFNMLQP